MSERRFLGWLAAALALLSVPATASAQGIIDFNSLAPGSVVTSVGSVGFAFFPSQSQHSGFPLIVSSGFAASSGGRYLGVQDGRSEFFQPGDRVDLLFGSPVNRVDVSFITPKGAPDGAFILVGGGGIAISTSGNKVVLPTGDTAITLHLFAPAPTFSVSVISNGVAPPFSIDDVVVPEPGLGALLAAGLGGVVGLARLRAPGRRLA